ncbi:MAG: secretin N-terminal domain-containing protein [Pseudomonas sp.]|uniref:secretin N-terminal domain-containing protein n=1 Tax=Pseudomonas abieticivorans TaxID=2931382 RepID=UPI0020C030D2|nr:secretin N-terminal domain-containing protein [Pseudomonas sp. PIA16]MDE1165285.1 secretin N-terminal domain-containing protein [Pseudomonas sp.]
MPLRPLLASLALLMCFTANAATEVLPLNYHTSDELLPVAQNFIGKDGQVSAYGNQLIVNADPLKIEALRDLLTQLDKPSRRLLISVDTSDSNDANRNGYSVNGGGNTRIISTSTANRTGGVQQVQASEGVPALIQVGQSVPFTTGQTDSYGGVQTQTQYRNVTQGFYVTASVTGDTVHLAISTNNDRISQQRPDVVDVQSTDTQVSGRLGEWITLAGVNEQSAQNTNGYTQNWSTQGRNDMTLRVKVDSLQ